MAIFSKKPSVSIPLPNYPKQSVFYEKPEKTAQECIDYFREVTAWAEKVKSKEGGVEHHKADAAWSAIFNAYHHLDEQLEKNCSKETRDLVINKLNDILLHEVEPKFGAWFESKKASIQGITYKEVMDFSFPDRERPKKETHNSFVPSSEISLFFKKSLSAFKNVVNKIIEEKNENQNDNKPKM